MVGSNGSGIMSVAITVIVVGRTGGSGSGSGSGSGKSLPSGPKSIEINKPVSVTPNNSPLTKANPVTKSSNGIGMPMGSMGSGVVSNSDGSLSVPVRSSSVVPVSELKANNRLSVETAYVIRLLLP